MVFYTFGKCFSMDCYCLIHFCGERKIRLRYIFSYNKSYSRPTSFTTTYIFSYTQSDSSIFFHTHNRILGQRLSGQRIFLHTRSRSLVYFYIRTIDVCRDSVYFFIHTIGLLYIFSYTQSDWSRPDLEKSIFLLKSFYKNCIFGWIVDSGSWAGPRKANFPFKILL